MKDRQLDVYVKDKNVNNDGCESALTKWIKAF